MTILYVVGPWRSVIGPVGREFDENLGNEAVMLNLQVRPDFTFVFKCRLRQPVSYTSSISSCEEVLNPLFNPVGTVLECKLPSEFDYV